MDHAGESSGAPSLAVVVIFWIAYRAHASTGALSDRFKIASKASLADINLSPQGLTA